MTAFSDMDGRGDFFFCFQAEDGIRDKLVTGVQTCALPIFEGSTGSEAAEELGHAMDAAGDHGGGEMMRAGDHVGDNFSFGRIGNRGLENADDGGGTLAEPDLLADHGGIAFESGGPETISEDCSASGVGAVVMHIEEPAEDRMQTHYFEIGPADNAGANFAGVAEANHGEADGGEVAEGTKGFHAGAQVSNFGY